MNLYDKLTADTLGILNEHRATELSCKKCWQTYDNHQLILSRDAAFELGGSGKISLNYTCFTDTENFENDEILLYGPDLNEIKNDCCFARIAVLSIKHSETDDDTTYLKLKDIEFAKYHVFLRGYMLRLSPESFREQVRVSREAIKNGISFSHIGTAYINEYKKNPDVLHVKLIFITDPAIDFKALRSNAYKADKITSSLNTIFSGIQTDCNTCELKEICDEVEGLRKIHFGTAKRNGEI